MKIKNLFVVLSFVLASLACTVTRISPTETGIPVPVATSTLISVPTSPTPKPTQNGEFTMDTTMIGALIGAAATILGAFISRTYADKQISQTKSSTEITPLVRTIIQVLNIFRVTGASVFVVKHDKTYIDAETGISIAVHNHSSVSNAIDITYHLPGQTKPQIVKNARLGWRVLVNYQNNLYTLTLMSMSGGVYVFESRFDFRKVNHIIAEVHNE
jgi:hypothetical protein